MFSPDFDSIFFNISVFIAGLFMLEYGADSFVDNTAIVAKCLGISEVLIALLTAGAEWEELAVVIAAMIQHRRGLAVGNVVGSAISNILGAFAIGLLFPSGVVKFDQSSKIYTGVLLVVTSMVSLLVIFRLLGDIAGGTLIAVFLVYVAAVAWSIYRGILTAPEDSDDSDSDSDDEEQGTTDEDLPNGVHEGRLDANGIAAGEATPLLPAPAPQQRFLLNAIGRLIVGFVALSLSGYILSHSSGTLARQAGISDSVFGATLLSIATTLPEKFVAVLSGSRGHQGILVANTVGSNIFLLTLCLGITCIGSSDESFGRNELIWLWVSSLVLAVTVFVGSRRIVGVLMLVAYAVFLVLEFYPI